LGSVIIALTPLFRSLPMACLAAIIIVNLKGLFVQMKDFIFYFQISLLECVSRRIIIIKYFIYFNKRFYGQ